MTTPSTAAPVNHTPGYLTAAGAVLAVIGAVVWMGGWHAAKKKIEVARVVNILYPGNDLPPLWTGTVIAGVVLVGIGALLLLAGLIGIATRRPT